MNVNTAYFSNELGVWFEKVFTNKLKEFTLKLLSPPSQQHFSNFRLCPEKKISTMKYYTRHNTIINKFNNKEKLKYCLYLLNNITI